MFGLTSDARISRRLDEAIKSVEQEPLVFPVRSRRVNRRPDRRHPTNIRLLQPTSDPGA
jgi:hypothetical protein